MISLDERIVAPAGRTLPHPMHESSNASPSTSDEVDAAGTPLGTLKASTYADPSSDTSGSQKMTGIMTLKLGARM